MMSPPSMAETLVTHSRREISCFLPPTPVRWCRCPGRGGRSTSSRRQLRRRPCTTRQERVAVAACASASASSFEPVEEGITLPPIESPEELNSERLWLSNAIRDWLDNEWQQVEPAPIHATIGDRVAQIYSRQRMEGEDDLSGVLLAVGQELESLDMSEAFVGPFNVANKVAELLLAESVGRRAVLPAYKRSPDAPVWSPEKDAEIEEQRMKRDAARHSSHSKSAFNGHESKLPSPPTLVDRFDKFMFLKQILDGSASSSVVSAVVAIVFGFEYQAESKSWSGAGVGDDFFRRYADSPPSDILGDSEAMRYVASRLEDQGKDEDEDDEIAARAESLDEVIDALHGAELARIQRSSGDPDFAKREVIVKYLHLFGGF